MVELIGSVAAFLTTACFFPQVHKVLTTRDTKSISLVMYTLFTLGVALWFVYGVLLVKWPIIIANIVTFTCSVIILAAKIRYG